MHAVLHQPVVNLIDIRKVINRRTVDVLAVGPDFIVKNCVEADIVESGDLLDVVQIAAITFAQAEDRASRSEHAFPKMRKRMNACGEINIDHLGRSLSLGLRGLRGAEEHNPQRCNREVHK